MYKLDDSINLNFLIDKELLQICISLYQLVFNFTENIAISTECTLRLIDISGSPFEIASDDPCSSSKLLSLLGNTITNIYFHDKDELTLTFSSGTKLVIIDSNDNFESFIIASPSQEIIV